jgi:hypothetical protein
MNTMLWNSGVNHPYKSNAQDFNGKPKRQLVPPIMTKTQTFVACEIV